MNSLMNLTPVQLRRAAGIQEEIAALQKELGSILGETSSPEITVRPGKKRKMSAATKAKIASAQKERWTKKQGKKFSGKVTTKPKRKMSAAAKAKLSLKAKARWAKARADGKNSL